MKRYFKIFATVLICLVLFIIAEWYTSRGKLPPSNVKSLDAYLVWRPDADLFVRLPNDQLMVLGPGVGLVPSGYSATVFDSKGDVVDSTSDIGDDPVFETQWLVSYPLQIESKSTIASGVTANQRQQLTGHARHGE